MLVASDLGLKNLQSKVGRMNENALFSEINSYLKRGVRPQVFEVSKDFIDSCIAATMEFFKSKNVSGRVKEEVRPKTESCSSDIRFVLH